MTLMGSWGREAPVVSIAPALSWPEGEARANEMFAEAEARVAGRYNAAEVAGGAGATTLAEAIMLECVELVALAVTNDNGRTVKWHELENVHPEPWHRFAVDQMSLRHLVGALLIEHGDTVRAMCLWHSHYDGAEPSGMDIRAFPEWLVEEATVYHAPTQTSHVYTGSGVISPASTQFIHTR